MAKRSTQQQEINRRRQIVSKLRHEGVRGQADIAERLATDYNITVTQKTISNDLKALDHLWKVSAIEHTDKWKKEVLEQYRFLYQQSIAAWDISLEDAGEMTSGDKEADKENDRSGAKIRVKGQSGNPAHIRNAQEALKAIRDVLGLDVPGKSTNFNIDISKLTNEQLERIANGEDPLHVVATS